MMKWDNDGYKDLKCNNFDCVKDGLNEKDAEKLTSVDFVITGSFNVKCSKEFIEKIKNPKIEKEKAS